MKTNQPKSAKATLTAPAKPKFASPQKLAKLNVIKEYAPAKQAATQVTKALPPPSPRKMVSLAPVSKQVEKRRDEIHKSHIQTHSRLDMIDPYLNTIANPFGVRGVQIPDEVTTSSATFSCYDRHTISTNGSGIASISYGVANAATTGTVCGSLVPANSATASISNILGCIGAPSQTDLNLFYNGSPTPPQKFTLPTWANSTSTIPALYTQVRLVSAGFRITFTGNLLNAGGLITAVSAPRDWLRSKYWDTIAPITLDMLQSHPSAKIISIPKCYGGEAIYVPMDPVSLSYVDIQDNYTQGNIPDAAKGAEIYLVVSGAPAAQNFFVEAMLNYEGIPSNNQYLSISTRVSKDDPISLAHTMNVVPEIDTTRGMTELKPEHILGADIVSSPADEQAHEIIPQHPAQEETLMDKLFDGLGKGISFGEKALGKLSPFLAML